MTPAHLCARLSELAYADAAGVAKGAQDLGLEVIGQYDRGGTQAFLFTDHRLAVLAYRGTEEWRDVFADLRYIKRDFPGGGRVHRGFLKAFNQVRDAVQADLRKTGLPVVMTGHSLGAALAMMAAVMWPAHAVHVYGCPRVGNGDFVKRLKCPVTRYENWFDPVTFVPPPNSPVQAVHALSHGRAPTLYRHGGKKVGLSAFGHPVRRYVKGTRAGV